MTDNIEFITEEDMKRLDNYEINTNVYQGNFTKVWPDLIPIDNSDVVIMNDAPIVIDPIVNLLFREAPEVLVKNNNERTQSFIDNLLSTNNYNALLKDTATWLSVKGDAVFQLTADEQTGVQIKTVNPKYFFGEFDPLDIQKLTGAKLFFPFDVGEEKLAFIQRHSPGFIVNELWRIKIKTSFSGKRFKDTVELVEQLPLDSLPRFRDLPEVEETGIDEILLVHALNCRCPEEKYGSSDFTNSLKSKFKARTQLETQRRAVTRKHMEPVIVLPKSVLEQLKNASAKTVKIKVEDLKLLGLAPQEHPPQAITWDAQLKYANDEDKLLFTQILEEAKIAPALLGASTGNLDGGETGRANIAKFQVTFGLVNTKQQLWEPVINDTLRKAQLLHNQIFPKDTIEVSDVDIIWKDHIFSDRLTRIQEEQLAVSSGLTSRHAAIRRLNGCNDKAVELEISRINSEIPTVITDQE